MRKIDNVIIHCSATPPRMDVGVSEINEWHKDRGFLSVGYHYVIRRNGALETGRAEAVVGAHTKGHNADSLGICLIGGVDEDLQAEDNFTVEQYHTLRTLLLTLKSRYGKLYIRGHRDFNPDKECPSFEVRDFLREYKV